MAIRRANKQDASRLSHVVLTASLSVKDADFTDQGWTILEQTNSASAFLKRFEDDDYFAIVYEVDSQIVGYLAMLNYSKIDHMFVLPDYRRMGICKQLWSVAKAICLKNGNEGYFWVRSSSFACDVYASFGFQSKGERECVNGISFQFMELMN